MAYKNDNLGRRMKENYEQISQTKLTRRTPVAIRIDGKAFHTFTKGFTKPFDQCLKRAMQKTMIYLCQNIQGVKFGYTQSDEITLILTDYDKLETQAWFNYEVQKMCSIAASMATMAFNRFFYEETRTIRRQVNNSFTCSEAANKLVAAYEKGLGNAMFDARCFNIPQEEVANLIAWRWLDAKRNSIQSVGQYHFSAKQLHGKNQKDICQMLDELGDSWDKYYEEDKFGYYFRKHSEHITLEGAAPSDIKEIRRIVNHSIEYEEED